MQRNYVIKNANYKALYYIKIKRNIEIIEEEIRSVVVVIRLRFFHSNHKLFLPHFLLTIVQKKQQPGNYKLTFYIYVSWNMIFT